MGFIVPPSKWEIQHARPIFAAQEYQAANNGQLPDTRAWRMLEFRHDLNPSRFNFYHPNIGRMIEAGRIVPPTETPDSGGPGGTVDPEIIPPIVDPPVDPPITPPLDPPAGQEVGPPTSGQQDAPAVPEPAAILMFAIAILSVGLVFQFQRTKRRSR